MLDKGDLDDYALWGRVVKATEEILSNKPVPRQNPICRRNNSISGYRRRPSSACTRPS